MSNWLITGAGRGIGLEMTRQVLARGDNVFAGVRLPSTAFELEEIQRSYPLNRLYILQLDVCDTESIRAAAEIVTSLVGQRGLDYVVNNAGIAGSQDLPSKADPQVMLDVYKTNVVGPTLVYQCFLKLLLLSKRTGGGVLVNTTTELASISSVNSAVYTSYALSKAALNMLTVKESLENSNIVIFCMSPGWVKTAMGGAKADLNVQTSARRQLQVIVSATLDDRGSFKTNTGQSHPW